MSVFVIDASVVVAVLLPAPHAELEFDISAPDTDLIAPDFLATEVANALWNQHRRGLITDDEARAAFRDSG